MLWCVLLFSTAALGLDCNKESNQDQFHPRTSNGLERHTLRDLAHDQACIWTSPIALSRNRNALKFAPFVGATAALIVTDRDVMRDYHPTPSQISRASHISNAGFYGMLGAGATFYAVGLFSKNDHARETGWLAGEAVVNGLAVNVAAQRITRRARPDAPSRPGEWFDSGRAFPSDHGMASWAAATVIAHEYSGWFTKLAAYGTAAAVSTTRVLAEKHSPSDVFVGSAIGYLIGNYVYHSRGTFGARLKENPLQPFLLRPALSPYLPLDSEYYPLLERLLASGYIDSAFLGLRPWRREECTRLVEEAEGRISPTADPLLLEILRVLKAEFSSKRVEDNFVESVYTRFTGISGEPLRDSYHFGQTLYNDYGRPYWTGGNVYAGASGATSMGPITFYARGEYQWAPGGPVYSPSTLTFVQQADYNTATPLVQSSADVSRFNLIEAYASFPWKNIDFSGGKEALWWGPGESGSMLFSNNAESIYMFRISQISPYRLGSFLSVLGPVKFDSFFGKLGGHLYPKAPYIHGQKISFKPTENLELGFSRTVMFAGVGNPLTISSFSKSFFSTGDSPSATVDPGDRRGGFDVSYRVPKLRRWLTVYADAFTDDDPSPLSAPQRSAYNPGIYLSHFPGIEKLDLRIETPITSLSSAHSNVPGPGGKFFYINFLYRDGYTNRGMLMGDWIGRQGNGVVATSKYSFAPLRTLQFSYRHATLDPEFIPSGGNYTDGRVSYMTEFKKNFLVSANAQIERWNVPMLHASPQRDSVLSFEVRWRPTQKQR
jgi:membrane-associated phospholipid phosphatase